MQVDTLMRESDAFSWYMERDPALRSTIVTVAWLDRSPRWDVLVDRLERACRTIPRFRMRLVEPPVRLSTPRWTVDDDFDLSWHLRRIDAPAPRTAGAVLDLARLAAMTAFDPAHPLWEFTLVNHLKGGRTALVMKLHHSLTDGVGGMQLALLLFDTDIVASRHTSVTPMPPSPGNDDAHGLGLVRETLGHDSALLLHAIGGWVRGGPATATHMARHPLRTAAAAVQTVESIGRTVAPVPDTRSPIMTRRSLRRQLDIITVGLSDLKSSASVAGGTVNDGFLAAITGGLRRYHDAHGVTANELRVTLPISIRKDGDPAASNRITLQRFAVPLFPEDPAARIRAIGPRCRKARDEPSLPHTNAIAGALNLLPPGVIGAMLKHVDFLASNVAGIDSPLYLGGAHVTGHVAFGPTIGAALNATLLSYDGTCFVGITTDEAAVPDTNVLTRHLAEGFDEVLALAGRRGATRLPLRAGSFPGETPE